MTSPLEATRSCRAAVAQTGGYDISDGRSSCFRVGGIALELRGSPGSNPTLERFRIVSSCAPEIEAKTQWTDAIQHRPGKPVFDSGSLWRSFGDGQGLRFDFISPKLGERPYRRVCVDDKYRHAMIELSEEYFDQGPQPHPLEYPLDELLIMHRLTQERAIELHGTGIVRANRVANLFVGHSGAGKSTTTRLWTSREEVEVLSDDRIIVRYDDGRDGPAGSTGMRMYGTPWHGEAMFASPHSTPLTRIFILEHGHGNVITRLTRSQAAGELFARAFVPFHRHEYLENALGFLEQLVSSVPCYRYSFEPDERAVEKVLQFND